MPDPFIEMMVDISSRMECMTKEKQNPKTPQPPDYTPTQAVLVEMLTQNTGCNILDSGGAYGRSWERNRHITDFRNLPRSTIHIEQNGSMEVSLNVFHFLDDCLERDTRSKSLENWFNQFANKNPDMYWPECVEEFFEQKLKKRGWEKSYGENTYNRESNLSQVLQYQVFVDENNYEFVWLQIHGGCDVRGGYTSPRVFLTNGDYELANEPEIYGYCKCSQAWSDGPSGCYWECTLKTKDQKFEHPHSHGKLIPYWHVRESERENENYEYFCTKCKTIVEWDI